MSLCKVPDETHDKLDQCLALRFLIVVRRNRDVSHSRERLNLDFVRVKRNESLALEDFTPEKPPKPPETPPETPPQIGFCATSCRAMMMRCNSLVPSPIAINGASR